MVGALPGHSDLACGRLTIDLAALAENYRLLSAKVAPTACAAVVKADAYGLGAEATLPALARAGASQFFVALPEEGLKARDILRNAGYDAEIYVLSGIFPGSEEAFLEGGLIPVLNDLGQVERWSRHAGQSGDAPLPAILHIDTGMNRLGLEPRDVQRLVGRPELLAPLNLRAIMSHLARAEEREEEMNARQLAAFEAALAQLPPAPASLANSAGIFLGRQYHFDLARPGIALYGCNPTPGASNPMRQVVTLEGRILQLRAIDAPETVGYGATYKAKGPRLIATVGVGYADGYLRSLSNSGTASFGGERLALVGRVSMDLTTFDATALPEGAVKPGDWVELIGKGVTLDQVAAAAGTIGYEILTDLGRRYQRVYRGA